MNLSFDTWKKYRLGDLFDIRKGKRLTSEDQINGSTPYIGAIDSNNGISNYIEQEPIHQGNTISLSYNGSVGEAFYQPKPFWATDDVNVLYFRKENGVNFNEYIGLFICTVLKQEKYRYCYGRKWVLDSMKETIIELPSNSTSPDWHFMEEYIKSLKCKPINTSNGKPDVVLLNTSQWKEFYLHRLFHTSMGNGIDAVQTTSENPKYSYIGRSASNNGIAGYIDDIDGETPFPAGAITLSLGGSLGSCFIQISPFYTAQNVAVLQEKITLSTFAKLFIVSIIQNECRIKYQAFGRELNAHYKKDFLIKLPVKHNGNNIEIDVTHEFSDDGFTPDWEYMENYIKSLPYGDRI